MAQTQSPIATFKTVVLDCPDPGELGSFYQRIVGGELSVDDDWATLSWGPGAARIAFQLAPNHVPPTWPNEGVPQQLHLDLTVDDIDVAEPAVLEAGARPTGKPDGDDENWRVYLDPAGHPFCLVW